MSRGKRQALFNYLPGRTFDFAKTGAIARITGVRGIVRGSELNAAVILRKISEVVRAWPKEFRPALRDDVLADPSRFVLLDPRNLQAELFPKVFWCDNQECGRVVDYSGKDGLPRKVCQTCRTGKLVQLRFVRIHRCGALEPLTPPACSQCKTTRDVALDTRGSERISYFRWVCRRCRTTTQLFGGFCPHCQWPGDDRIRRMDIEVHRAGRTHYAHTAVLLNVPRRDLDQLFALADWQSIVAATWLQLPETNGRKLTDWAVTSSASADDGLSGAELEGLLSRQASGELSPTQVIQEMQRLKESKANRVTPTSALVVDRTGVAKDVWDRSGQELFEYLMPFDVTRPRFLVQETGQARAQQTAEQLGLSSLALASDYPILTTTFGYSRGDYRPRECQLNPFPVDRDLGGKFPVFVDQVQADALLLTLDRQRVLRWLAALGLAAAVPPGSSREASEKAFFVSLFDEAELLSTIEAADAQRRLVFGLLHTMSHLAVKRASMLSGLEATSLSEYLLPKSLTFALYCNHRFGATIGALTALFEQSCAEWLAAVRDSRFCVYDPVCRRRESSCHACTHLSETSCRHFNLNLSRAFLFGGNDAELGNVAVGYLDSSLTL